MDLKLRTMKIESLDELKVSVDSMYHKELS